MKHLLAGLVAVALVAGSLVVVSLGAQSAARRRPAAPPAGRCRAPPDGHPDLQGVWGNNSVTPMTRPAAVEGQGVADRRRSRGAEADGRQVRRSGRRRDLRQLRSADARRQGQGQFAQVSYDPTHRQLQPVLDGRSRVGQPHVAHHRSAGRPVSAADARGRGAARGRAHAGRATRGPADGPEDRPLSERCISYGAPRTGANYNSYVQIIQSPQTTVLLQEMIHDARIVPMTPRPHLPPHIRQLHGDPRGRWDGDTLVVETTNYINGFQGSTPDVKLTERYTRVSPDFINWEITVDDPKTWTRPYTFMIRLKKTDALIYEYACHEGNYSMEGILAGARARRPRRPAGPERTDACGERRRRYPRSSTRRGHFTAHVLSIIVMRVTVNETGGAGARPIAHPPCPARRSRSSPVEWSAQPAWRPRGRWPAYRPAPPGDRDGSPGSPSVTPASADRSSGAGRRRAVGTGRSRSDAADGVRGGGQAFWASVRTSTGAAVPSRRRRRPHGAGVPCLHEPVSVRLRGCSAACGAGRRRWWLRRHATPTRAHAHNQDS